MDSREGENEDWWRVKGKEKRDDDGKRKYGRGRGRKDGREG